jgi:hypothetical protein
MRGEVYLSEEDIQLLRTEPSYVRKRYRAVARTLCSDLVRITREDAADLIGISKRQLQRVVRRFREEGIPGLRFRSRAPHTTPRNKTSAEIERRVVDVRKATGFGSEQLATIVNESLRVGEDSDDRVTTTDTTCYNILVRNGLVAAEKRIRAKYRSFEWGHPDALIQSDLTEFNGLPILTIEDDNSRRGWAMRLDDPTDDAVVAGMERLHPYAYENLLTDNGSQFCRKNSTMRRYCDGRLTGKHIWSSVHHPQTLGKLSAFQKGLKRFLVHRFGRIGTIDKDAIDACIATYVSWYNNGKKVRTTGCYPEERYSGTRDDRWYDTLVKALKLDSSLPLPVQGG